MDLQRKICLYLSSCVIGITCIMFLTVNYFSEELKPKIGRLIQVMSHVNPIWDNVPYDHYGCWCSSINRGETVDAIDRCCKVHFYCYQDIISNNGCTNDANEYSFTIVPGDIKCDLYNTFCRKQCCECDITLLKCITDHMTEYKSEHYLKNVKHLCKDDFES